MKSLKERKEARAEALEPGEEIGSTMVNSHDVNILMNHQKHIERVVAGEAESFEASVESEAVGTVVAEDATDKAASKKAARAAAGSTLWKKNT